MHKKQSIFKRSLISFSDFLGSIRKIFLNLLTLAVLLIIAGALIDAFSTGSTDRIPDSAALRVEIEGTLVDQLTYIDPLNIALGAEAPQETLLSDVVDGIELAVNDDRITSMVLVLEYMNGGGLSKIEELGASIERFKKQGKTVIAVADNYSQGQYLLATYADHIIMNPMGYLELTGLSSYRTFMADAIEKLNIDIHVFRTGEHKNALEPFIRSSMSDASKEQYTWLLEDLWTSMVEGIVARRPVSQEDLDTFVSELDQLLVSTNKSVAELVLELGFVDHLSDRNELMDFIQSVAGSNERGDFYPHINVTDYLLTAVNFDQLSNKNKIGYVVAKGNILDGTQDSGTIGGDSLAWQLKQARLDGDLSALVLRVDSPGGSAFASEIIRSELEKYEIPIVVSMGSVAASGGYWIATPADEVWAAPTTVTGSIGAFAAIPTVDRAMNSLGLQVDGVGTSNLAGSFRLDRPLAEPVKTILQTQIDRLYEQFLGIVSSARSVELGDLKKIAAGRVWTGNQALEYRLVDHLGYRLDAIEAAARLANISDNYAVKKIEPQLSFTEQFMKEFLNKISVTLGSSLNNYLPALKNINNLQSFNELKGHINFFSDPNNLYIHCAECNISI